MPYYADFYEQIIDLVKICNYKQLRWLDVGCGTGKMAELVLKNFQVEQFTFCDCSTEMLEIAKKRFSNPNLEFILSDVQQLSYVNAFDVVTAIQVNHYLNSEGRKIALQKCYEALKENGLFVYFENFAPFSEMGKQLCLDKWKKYQIKQGKSSVECEKHIKRYGKEYFPITITEHLKVMNACGFRTVEVLWLSNMQVGIWGIK